MPDMRPRDWYLLFGACKDDVVEALTALDGKAIKVVCIPESRKIYFCPDGHTADFLFYGKERPWRRASG